MKSFAELFKKYRLRAEFETFSSFSDALSEKGFYYEESIFSHWQKGTITPNNRQLILKIIEIFKERESITTIDEANDFLASAGLGYLTDKERDKLAFAIISQAPFQVPNEIAHFTGRKELVTKIQKEILGGKIVLLHGSPGIGKTALAIKLGHLLQKDFPDGVLWYKVDSTNTMDILLSIARLFGEDIGEIKDSEVRASIIRTLLAKKKVLLIFDNVTRTDKLHLLLPSSGTCSVILSSQESVLSLTNHYRAFPVHIFTQEEVLALFQKVFDKKYVAANKKSILALGEKVGNLPLAVNISATHLKQFGLSAEDYIRQLKNSFDLKVFKYEDKSLLQTVSIGFNSLGSQEQKLFSSLGVFEGKDFSVESVASVNKLSLPKTEEITQQLLDISFLEKSKIGRYRMHTLLKVFAREQIKDTSVYLHAAVYYEQLLVSAEKKNSYKSLMQEIDNIIYIFKKCYDFGYWDQIIILWNPVEKFLSDTNEIKKLRSLARTIDTAPSINIFQKVLTAIFILVVLYWVILHLTGLKTSFWNYFYNLLLSIIPFFGGFVGVFRSRSWGFLKTDIGKAIFFISSGLFLWGSGNAVWTYYNLVMNIALPYPSIADIFYFPGYCVWVVSIIYLMRATGIKLTVMGKSGKLYLLMIPTLITIISYYFLLVVVKRDFSSATFLKNFLDLGYPSLDIINVTFSSIILGFSVNFFGGKYRLSLFSILIGFVFMYTADFMLTYYTSIGTYFNAYLGDFLFTIGTYLLAWGTLNFYLTPKRKT